LDSRGHKNSVAGSGEAVVVASDSFQVVDGGEGMPVAVVLVLVAEGGQGFGREVDLESFSGGKEERGGGRKGRGWKREEGGGGRREDGGVPSTAAWSWRRRRDYQVWTR
jgi:hypothetical protein